MKVYDITPMGKPRMTRADKWKKRPEVLRYRAFCDEVRLQGVELPESGSHVTFILPMPASWGKRNGLSSTVNHTRLNLISTI